MNDFQEVNSRRRPGKIQYGRLVNFLIRSNPPTVYIH